MSLQSRAAALITAIGTDIKSHGDQLDELELTTLELQKPPLVSVLPSLINSSDREEVLFQTTAMRAAGIPPWHLKLQYNMLGSYQWTVLSAEPLYDEASMGGVYVGANVAGGYYTGNPGGSWIKPVTPRALSITTPLPGVYKVHHGALLACGGTYAMMSWDATGVTANYHLRSCWNGDAGGYYGSASRCSKATVPAANAEFTDRITCYTSATIYVADRWMEVKPVLLAPA